MKGLIKKGKKYGFQAGIPKDVREHFDGIKKFQRMFDTDDPIHAERLAEEAEREFKSTVMQHRQNALNGERMDPTRQQQIAGWLFGQYFAKLQDDRYFDLRESIKGVIAEAQEDGFPLVHGLHSEGLVFDGLIQSVETLLEWAEGTGYAKKRTPDRPGATLTGAHAIWQQKARHTAKTKNQYGKDVREFTAWFEERRGHCYGTKITKRDVNDYVTFLMHKNAAKATINRSLSALRLIYKSGQFGVENPFSGVSDRMVIEGSELKVRRFSDAEVNAILQSEADHNTHMCVLIAAYSGMRLSEIASLKLEHIERAGRARVFNLMNAGRRKTSASYRKVPVHPSIWKELEPFIRGRAPSDYLLPDETADQYGNRSAALSKRINRLIDKITPDPSAREHGFRHTLISKLAEAGVRKEWRMAIVGHAGDDVHDEYNHADYLAQLLQHIARVQY